MLSFQITLHTCPPDLTVGPNIELRGQRVKSLVVNHDSLAIPFAVSFEEAAIRLEQLERLFFEPDGSFVWTSSQTEPSWQVDGNLFDRDGRLLFVDLKGTCPTKEFDRLLSAFGWPVTPVVFQLTREAIFLDETQFRQFAAKSPHG